MPTVIARLASACLEYGSGDQKLRLSRILQMSIKCGLCATASSGEDSDSLWYFLKISIVF